MNRRACLAVVVLLAACAEPGDDPGVDAGVDPDAAPPFAATRYPPSVIRSPVTEAVAVRLRVIAERGAATQRADVFAKIGDSHTVSTSFLHCFAGAAGSPYVIDLAGRDAVLMPTLDRFRTGTVGATTPFDRASLAAMIGRSASWALAGSPSPLQQELAATTPAYAFVAYGSNDMELGTTHASALPGFWNNLSRVLDEVAAAGAVPIVVGLPPRSDMDTAARWVPTYDAVTRAIAESRQVPYISMYQATRTLPELGLAGDGLHHNVYVTGGRAQPCVLTAAGLAFGNNQRNLHHLDALAAATAAVDDVAPDADVLPAVSGAGTMAEPFVVDLLPFTHTFDTTGGERALDGYPACDTGQDESGPEVVYQLSLPSPAAIRVLALDRDVVDVDVHVLDASGTCVERDDWLVQRMLPAGEHTIVVDTFTSARMIEHAGAYTLVIVACEPGDVDCAAPP
ncbi:MAG TPA: GDSL-type esterase/lipase family protein [Kofleriaceae bacterium]|nr:GDSL-type esterase/lipase family protein [Kofleriaceae bacterium]